MKSKILLLALILSLHFDPAWALLLILIAIGIKLFPLAIALEIAGPVIITYIKKHRR